MRRLLILVLVLLAAFGAYWAGMAWTVERSLAGWFEARRADGWVAEQSGIAVSGFPTDFRWRVVDPSLADPETGVAWAAPAFTITAPATAPNRIRAIWPERQTLASPFERLVIEAEVFEAGVAFIPGTRLELERTDARFEALRFAPESGAWRSGLGSGGLTLTAIEDRDNAYAVDFHARDVLPAEPLRRGLDPAGLLPERVEGLTAEGTVAFNAPLDRFAIERARPQITALDLDDLRAAWGNLELRAAGELTVDASGIPAGRITVKATNWREMVTLARNAGLLPDALAPTVEAALEVLAGLSGPSETLDAPLTFDGGRMLFGPIPLGPAPRLTIR